MPPSLTWLHLSDLHAGAPGKNRDWAVVRDAFARDLATMPDRVGPPDVVFFTGDLTWSGIEYEEVADLVVWLRLQLGDVPIVAVPGNHDLVRPTKGRWGFLYGEDRAATKDREAALQDGSVAELFDGWTNFAREHLAPPEAQGLLPGDARHSFDIGGFKLGLLGLNSAWRQVADLDHRGHVEVAPAQVNALLPQGADAFRDAHHLCLLLQHHPPEWMSSNTPWRSHIATAAHAVLFGHTHANEATVRQAESDERFALVQARSLCGLDHFGTEREDRRFGYRWGRAEVVDAGVDGRVTRVWTGARTLVEGERWEFRHPERSAYDEAKGMRLVDVPVPRGLRPVAAPRPGPVVAVLAVRAELGAAQDAVATRLDRLAGLGRVQVQDAASPGFAEADLAVILIGGRTGGRSHLADGLARPEVLALKTSQLDLARLVMDELPAAQALHAGISRSFDSPEDAAEQALAAVGQWLAARAPASPAGPPVLHEHERAYLAQRLPAWIQGRHSALVALAGTDKLHRAALYVPLLAETDLVYASKRGKVQLRPPGAPGDALLAERQERRRPVRVERALCLPGLETCVVEGDPGAGKTVLLQHLATVLASTHLAKAVPPHELDLVALQGDRPLLPIPVFLEASALARRLAVADGQRGLAQAIQDELHTTTNRRSDLETICAGLRAGRYLVLLDALDEVPGHDAQRRVVQLLAGLGGPGLWRSRVVLSTRPTVWIAVSLDELAVLRIAELDRATATQLVNRWCEAQHLAAEYRDGMVAALFEAARRHRGARFSTNPMLLTAAMLVYSRQQALPDSTAALYQDLVEVLCVARKTRWPVGEEGEVIDKDIKRQALERIFLAMQEAGGTELAVMNAAELLRDWKPGQVPDLRAGEMLLDRLANDTGLLRFDDRVEGRHRRRVVKPWHRSFEEYLAACQLAAREGAVVEELERLLREGRITDPTWEGVLRFLVGVHGARGSDRARAWVGGLHRAAQEPGAARRGRLFGLVASALAEYREHFDGSLLVGSLPGEIVRVFEAEGESWPVADRLLVLEALGALGDPRLGDPRLGDPLGDDRLWVRVLGGRFTMGRDQSAYQAAPPHEVVVPDLRIAWRPTTVQDYRPFVESGHPAPEEWDSQLFHLNRPVVGLSWHDAVAFCVWATKAWAIPVGHRVRLPREAEWEYVAAGADGRVFPWGDEPQPDDERASFGGFQGKGPGEPTPVGAYPAGAVGTGPQRIVDLVGNVWEWCADAWRDADDADKWRDGGHLSFEVSTPAVSARVVRGGSWGSDPGDLRCAFRDWFTPQYRIDFLGFRVVCVPAREP